LCGETISGDAGHDHIEYRQIEVLTTLGMLQG